MAMPPVEGCLMIFWLISQSFAASIDFKSSKSIRKANSKAAGVMMKYWEEAKADESAYLGSFKESANEDKSVNGWNWYESGILWGAIMDYTKVTGDQRYAETAVQSLTVASFNSAGSFLGPKGTRLWSEAVNGKWNDDIGWWVMGAVTGMEIYGEAALMPGGVSYGRLTFNTLEEMLEQWDSSSICPGGIYWSRNRFSDDTRLKNYKSTISNAQALIITVRAAKFYSNPELKSNGKRLADWLISVTDDDGLVHDGITVTSTPRCDLATNHQSYTAGMTAGALALFATYENDQKYMDIAEKIIKTSLQVFAIKGVITDACEPIWNPNVLCQINSVTPKGTYIRGLVTFYKSSKNEELKSEIRSQIIKSVNAILPLCDKDFVCNTDNWSQGSLSSKRNKHAQLNAIELFNALTIVTGSALNDVEFLAPNAHPPSEGWRWDSLPIYMYATVVACILLLISIVTFGIWKVNKKRKEKELDSLVSLETWNASNSYSIMGSPSTKSVDKSKNYPNLQQTYVNTYQTQDYNLNQTNLQHGILHTNYPIQDSGHVGRAPEPIQYNPTQISHRYISYSPNTTEQPSFRTK